MITITKDIKKQISKNQKITGLSAALENYEYGIRNGMFKFVPSRIVYNKRPLAIVSSRDKIVQKGMKHLLEMIFEGSFCDSNHGFRVKRGFHTAINHMRIHFGGARWFIKGDIKRDFELFNHKILMDLIKERVEDQAFIDLLYKYLRVGYIADLYGVEHPKTGVPQGGVISPILSNIYMHGLDLFVEERLKERRVHYIRYGSEFLIGATGSKEDCEEIRAEIGK
jgi:retron-type reverse transcriptase